MFPFTHSTFPHTIAADADEGITWAMAGQGGEAILEFQPFLGKAAAFLADFMFFYSNMWIGGLVKKPAGSIRTSSQFACIRTSPEACRSAGQ